MLAQECLHFLGVLRDLLHLGVGRLDKFRGIPRLLIDRPISCSTLSSAFRNRLSAFRLASFTYLAAVLSSASAASLTAVLSSSYAIAA